jgi:hypothetical protein
MRPMPQTICMKTEAELLECDKKGMTQFERLMWEEKYDEIPFDLLEPEVLRLGRSHPLRGLLLAGELGRIPSKTIACLYAVEPPELTWLLGCAACSKSLAHVPRHLLTVENLSLGIELSTRSLTVLDTICEARTWGHLPPDVIDACSKLQVLKPDYPDTLFEDFIRNRLPNMSR